MTLFQNSLVKRWKTLDKSWRFAITAFLIARLFYTLWSWTILTIQPLAVQNIQLSGEPILTVFNLHTSERYTYLRKVNGETLTFRALNQNTVIDLQTGSVWDISSGIALQGRYEGITLLPSTITADEIFPYHGETSYPVEWLAIWQRFDANWYSSVAENGYGNAAGDDHFPPMFPLLVRLLKPLFGSAFLTGLVIVHLCTLCVIKLLYDLFVEWGGDPAGRRATLLFLLYPAAFFLFSVYSESVFLVTVLLSLKRMQARSWAWAGFWAFCAILTRLQGVAVLIPMLYLMWLDRPFLRKTEHWFGLFISALGGLFYLFLRSKQVTTGAIPFAEADWHAQLVLPWETYVYAIQTLLSGQFTFIDFLNWAVTTIFLVLLAWGWRKIPLEYNLYTAFSLLIILSRIVETQPLISMSRYSLTLFPMFFILALAGKNAWTRRIIIYTFISLNLYLSAQFFSWGWVA